MDWVDKCNDGVSHYGLNPTLFPLESIWFDTFHLRSAITHQLLACLRNFIFEQRWECKKEFETLVASVWNCYYVFVWRENRKFTSLKGKQVRDFIAIIPEVVAFIKKKFVESHLIKNLCGGLILWKKISQFIHRTKSHDGIQYEKDIIEFKTHVKEFYKYGSGSFLSKKNVGDKETFYIMHILRFYIPVIVDNTWKTFKLEVGVFTMQGFERWNK